MARKLDASQTPNGANAKNESIDRLSQLRQLYFNSYSFMRESTYERLPELLPWDFDTASAAVAGLLHTYGGPLDAESFERWAKRKIVEESFRYIALRLAMGEYKLMLLSTISKSMWTSAEDCSIGADDLFSEILMLIFQMGPKFLRSKRAKLSTRLCALAKRHVYFYFNKKNKKRLAAVTKHLENDGVFEGAETLSAVEIASMRKDRAVSDLGYAETGLSLA